MNVGNRPNGEQPKAIAHDLPPLAAQQPDSATPQRKSPSPLYSEKGSFNGGRGDRIRTYDPLLPKPVEEMAAEIIRHPKGLARLVELYRELCEVNGGRTPTPDPQGVL